MIIDELKTKFPDMPDLRVRSIKVDRDVKKVFCTLSYPNSRAIPPETKRAIIDKVKSVVPSGYYCAVSLVDDKFTEVSFKRHLFEIIRKQFPLFATIDKEKTQVSFVDTNKIQTVFSVNSILLRNIELCDFCNKLAVFFAGYTCYECEFLAEEDVECDVENRVEEQEKLVRLAINKELLKPSRHHTITDVAPHIGKEIHGSPMYISDIREQMDSCILCGRIFEKTLKKSKNNPNVHVCKFVLADDSGGKINCIMFAQFQVTDIETLKQTVQNKSDAEVLSLSRRKMAANDKKMKKLMAIYDTMSVVVRGKVTFNKFAGQLEMVVYDMCNCNILPISSRPFQSKPVPQSYMLVKPEEYVEYKQMGFDEILPNSNKLYGQNVVVLHADVTGKNKTKDKMVAICAIKILNGNIVQKFATFVNPEKSIEDHLLSKWNTAVSKLPFFPTLTEIVGDLYKFTYGSTLLGTDLGTIIDLVNYYAAPVGYCFENKVIEQSEFFSQTFDELGANKKPDCQKLEDVAKACKVPIVNVNAANERCELVANCIVKLAKKLSAKV